MTDYKELCENPQAGWGYVDELRDAIKQLVKERDAAVEDLRVCSFRADRECVYCKNEGIEMCNKCGMKAQNWHWRGCVDGDNC